MKAINSYVAQMLVIFRNPKDTLVSFYHFSNNNPLLPSGQSWESFYSHFLSGDGEWRDRGRPEMGNPTM